jgi:hypothetical protein
MDGDTASAVHDTTEVISATAPTSTNIDERIRPNGTANLFSLSTPARLYLVSEAQPYNIMVVDAINKHRLRTTQPKYFPWGKCPAEI